MYVVFELFELLVSCKSNLYKLFKFERESYVGHTYYRFYVEAVIHVFFFFYKMTNLSSLIRHSGIWNDENKYVNYKIDAVTFKEYSTYEELL